MDLRQTADDSVVRHTTFSDRTKHRRDTEMGSDADASRRVVRTHVGEEKEHEESPFSGPEVHIELVANLVAAVDVPPRIAGILGAGEPDREGADIRSRVPASTSDELVEGREQSWGVCRLDEWRSVRPGYVVDEYMVVPP
jgi:hypothetical protein